MNDMPSVYEETFPKARKEHTCCECKRPISPGQKYQHAKGLWNGEWDTFKTCIPCHELRERIAYPLPYDEGPAFGQLKEWCMETEIEFPLKAQDCVEEEKCS